MPPADCPGKRAAVSVNRANFAGNRMNLTLGSYDLRPFDFKYDPFAHLDAARDPYLFDYLVPPRDAAIAWEDVHALVFAPRGGGKTALRHYAEDNCLNQTWELKFPVTYIPGNFDVSVEKFREQTLAYHLRQIQAAVATDIFRHFLWKPDHFGQLPQDLQLVLLRSFDAYLTNPKFTYLLEILGTERSAAAVCETIARPLALPTPPTPEKLQELHQTLVAALPQSAARPAAPLEVLFDLILGPLEAQSLYIFIDGVDAFPETNHNPERVARWITPLIERGAEFSQRGVYLKFFLPMDVKDHLRAARQIFPSVTLDWDHDFLVDILQSRVSAASQNKFNSLDAKSSPTLRGIEEIIVHKLPQKLPREALHLTRSVLEAAARRWEITAHITPADLEAGYRHYDYYYRLRTQQEFSQKAGIS